MSRGHRFTATHITVMVVAICLAVVAAPVGVMAATGSLVNITDPSVAANKARVTAKGSLAISPRDPITGAQARVDSSGRQLVAVGNPVTKVTTVPGLPGTPYTNSLSNGLTVPAGKTLVVETLSVNVDVTSGNKMEAAVRYTTGGHAAYLWVPIQYSYTAAGYDTYEGALSVKLYADAGTSIYVSPYSATGSTGTPFLTVSGYLI